MLSLKIFRASFRTFVLSQFHLVKVDASVSQLFDWDFFVILFSNQENTARLHRFILGNGLKRILYFSWLTTPLMVQRHIVIRNRIRRMSLLTMRSLTNLQLSSLCKDLRYLTSLNDHRSQSGGRCNHLQRIRRRNNHHLLIRSRSHLFSSMRPSLLVPQP